MAQQTAVEWFEKNISKFISYHYEKAYEEHNEVSRIFEQAKEMEKEQMLDAYNSDRYPWSKQDALKYYNETYNK